MKPTDATDYPDSRLQTHLWQALAIEGAVRGIVERRVAIILRIPHHNDLALLDEIAFQLAEHDQRPAGGAAISRAGQFIGDGEGLADLPPRAAHRIIVAVGDR